MPRGKNSTDVMRSVSYLTNIYYFTSTDVMRSVS